MDGLHQIFGWHTNEMEIVRVGDTAHQDIHLAEGEDALQAAPHDMFDRERLPGWPFRTLEGQIGILKGPLSCVLWIVSAHSPQQTSRICLASSQPRGLLKARRGL